MKIAHINNTSGVASIIAEEQRKEGHDVDIFVFSDIIHSQFGGTKINYRWPISRWKLLRKLEKEYDIWHYHHPYGSLKRSLEKRARKKIYLKHYHGDELRGKYDSGFCLVSTPDLLRYAPNGKWLPNPVKIEEVESINKTQQGNTILRVAHYPYYKNYRSDDYYSDTLTKLQKEGKCEVVNILNLNHREVLEAVSMCDIVVGKILPSVGWFGKFELEGMALGKPIIAYVSDELYQEYKPPVYRTTKETFHQDLENLLVDEGERKRLASQGPSYVKRHHSPDNICNIVRQTYEELNKNDP
jgi:glycosyltransferase involved in cell wall biosynthesis